jgi:hypothetical protein
MQWICMQTHDGGFQQKAKLDKQQEPLPNLSVGI